MEQLTIMYSAAPRHPHQIAFQWGGQQQPSMRILTLIPKHTISTGYGRAIVRAVVI